MCDCAAVVSMAGAQHQHAKRTFSKLNDKTSAAAVVHQSLLDATAFF
jgi:hypothetical protein